MRPTEVARVVLLSVPLAGSLWIGTAHAGCADTCDVRLDSVMVNPPLACLEVDQGFWNCDCTVWVGFINGCTVPIDPDGFQFAPCPTSDGASCTLAPSTRGNVYLKVSDAGRKQWSFRLLSDGVEHIVTVGGEVTSYDAGGGCGCPFMVGASSVRPGFTALAAAVVLSLGMGRRRGKRRRCD